MIDKFTLLQNIGLGIYLASVIFSFFYSLWHRKKISIGSLVVTLPASIVIFLILKLDFIYSENMGLSTLGLIFLLLGILLAKSAFSHLGFINSDDFWFGRKEKKERHLVTTGLYKYIRHPIFVGLVLEYLGIVLLFLHIIPVILFVAVLIFGIYTEYKEEEFMISRFSEYKDYKKITGMFFPKLFK